MVVNVVNDILVVNLQQIIELRLVLYKIFNVKTQRLFIVEESQAGEKVLVVEVVDQNENDIGFGVDRDKPFENFCDFAARVPATGLLRFFKNSE